MTGEVDPFSLWTYRARTIRVIDGDTVVLEADVGFGCRYEATVRAAGIDAPELRTASGPAARDALDVLLSRQFGEDEWPLRVVTRRQADHEARSFARYVATIWVSGPDGTWRDVAEAMVEQGHARRVSS